MPFLMLAALLAGCATAEQTAQRNEERCTARGYQPKTDAFSDCIVRLDSEHEQRMTARRQEMLSQSAQPSSATGH